MKQETPLRWPPIIEFARAPWWVRVRDFVLTFGAWTLMAYLMRDGVAMLVDYFRHPIFELTRTHAPDWLEVWDNLHTFLIFALISVLWLALWGLINRRRLRFAARQTPPTRLPLEQHVASFELEAGEIERWREMKIAVVQFDAAHRIKGVMPGIERRGQEEAHPLAE